MTKMFMHDSAYSEVYSGAGLLVLQTHSQIMKCAIVMIQADEKQYPRYTNSHNDRYYPVSNMFHIVHADCAVSESLEAGCIFF